jgi:hypothetical protein
MTPAQLKKELLKLDVQTLTEIIISAINRNTPFKNAVLEQLTNKVTPIQGQSTAPNSDISDSLLQGTWKEMKKIVAKSNREGYEDSATRNKFDKLYTKMEDLLGKQICSRIERMKVVDEAIEQRGINNSGFIGNLDDLLLLLCYDRRDWLYLQKQYTALQSKAKHYEKQTYGKIILAIQKNKLADEETYIELSRKNLHTGNDYLELGRFYIEKKQDETEGLSILKQGLLAGVYNSESLVQYLFTYYVKHNKEKEIAALVGMNHADSDVLLYLLNNLYNYYKLKDYEIAKRIIKQKIVLGKQLTYQFYKEAAEFLKPSDWETLKPIFIANTKKENNYALCNTILIADHQYKEALDNMDNVIKNTYYGFISSLNEEIMLMLRQIGEKLPQETIAYADKLAKKFISMGQRSHYEQAAILLKLVLTTVSSQPEFVKIIQQKIESIKATNVSKVALLEELKKQGL